METSLVLFFDKIMFYLKGTNFRGINFRGSYFRGTYFRDFAKNRENKFREITQN